MGLEDGMGSFSDEELVLLKAASGRRGLTLERLVAKYQSDELCSECLGSHRSCAHSSPCLGGCGRRTTPYESSAPGYCLFCAVDPGWVSVNCGEDGEHRDDCACEECFERRVEVRT